MVPKQYALSRNNASDSDLLAFPEPATCSTTLFCILGRSSEPQLTVTYMIMRANDRDTENQSVSRQPSPFSPPYNIPWASPVEPAHNAGDTSSTPGSDRFPGGGNGNPLQDFCLENPMDSGAWWATVQISAQKYKTSNKTDQRYMKLESLPSLGVELRISTNKMEIKAIWKAHIFASQSSLTENGHSSQSK